MLAPPGELVPPLRGNPGSATAKKYLCSASNRIKIIKFKLRHHVFLTEEEFQSIGSSLRNHYKKTMKIEMVPWAKAYTVDMKDMYTDLTLEKIENQPSGPSHLKINDYKVLFTQNQDLTHERSSKGNKLSKIPIPSKTVKKSSQRELTGAKLSNKKHIKMKIRGIVKEIGFY